MKKHITLFIVCLLVIGLGAQETETSLTSTIEEVRVFTQGAQITRNARTILPEGESTIVLTGLSAVMDPNSVRIVFPVATQYFASLLAVNHRYDYLGEQERNENVATLKGEKDGLENALAQKQAEIEVLEAEAKLLQANQQIGGQQNGYALDDLRSISSFYRERLLTIRRQQISLGQQTDSLKTEIEKRRLQLAELQQKSDTKGSELVLKIKARRQGELSFTFSYLCRDAGWFPGYDLRVQDVDSPVQLTYKARVHQNTGENWTNVRLLLSNADPTQAGSAPALPPYYLSERMQYMRNNDLNARGIYNPAVRQIKGVITDNYGEPLIGATVLLKGTSVGTTTDLNGGYQLPVPVGTRNIVVTYLGYQTVERSISQEVLNISMDEDIQRLEEVVITGYALQGRVRGVQTTETAAVPTEVIEYSTSVDFEVSEPYTIPSNGKEYSINLQNHPLPATYEYRIVPKANEKAYLQAFVTQWEQYQLLTGEANLFFEGAFLGKSLLDTRYVQDTLTLDLGRDQGISVQREEVRAFSKSVFLGNKKETTRAWRITLRNNKQSKVSTTVIDQVPVSQAKDIAVAVEEVSGGLVNEETGQVTWEIELAPQQSKELLLRYSVRYPKGYQLIIK